MKKIAVLTIVLPVIAMLASQAAASYITMSTTISSDVFSGGSGQVSVSVSQMGDEAAYEVEAVPMDSDYFEFQGSVKSKIMNPGDKISGTFNTSVRKELKTGNYPVVMMTIYHDANLYPFSVVSPHTVTYEDGRNSGIFGSIRETELAKEGRAESVLLVRNLDSETREVKVKLYLPRELSSGYLEKTVHVGPKEEKEIEINIGSVGALVGSSYSVLASLEYDDDYHYTSFASGRVAIVEKQDILGIPYFWVFAIVIILVAAFVSYQVWGFVSERRKKKESH